MFVSLDLQSFMEVPKPWKEEKVCITLTSAKTDSRGFLASGFSQCTFAPRVQSVAWDRPGFGRRTPRYVTPCNDTLSNFSVHFSADNFHPGTQSVSVVCFCCGVFLIMIVFIICIKFTFFHFSADA